MINKKIIFISIVALAVIMCGVFLFLIFRDNSKTEFSDLYQRCLANRTERYNSNEFYELQQCNTKLSGQNCNETEKMLENKTNSPSAGESFQQYLSDIYYLCCENGIKKMVVRICSENILTEQGRNTILQQLENKK